MIVFKAFLQYYETLNHDYVQLLLYSNRTSNYVYCERWFWKKCSLSSLESLPIQDNDEFLSSWALRKIPFFKYLFLPYAYQPIICNYIDVYLEMCFDFISQQHKIRSTSILSFLFHPLICNDVYNWKSTFFLGHSNLCKDSTRLQNI